MPPVRSYPSRSAVSRSRGGPRGARQSASTVEARQPATRVGGLAEVAKVARRVVFTVDEQDEARATVKGQLGANTRQAKSAEVLSPEERLGYWRLQ